MREREKKKMKRREWYEKYREKKADLSKAPAIICYHIAYLHC